MVSPCPFPNGTDFAFNFSPRHPIRRETPEGEKNARKGDRWRFSPLISRYRAGGTPLPLPSSVEGAIGKVKRWGRFHPHASR
ncbi:MAG: hypothetical protein D6812_18075 [Deltaproteobacteria bacterium]|nr:MAG: hypothetical protein D6812_18075 [Deltaproteobacteria bacterium]